ncbi:hypothetical protein FOA52_009966 [Chlamydomonas sp. UWO 241]|nr:hypothetical protein FOA52_009966 [Chlamydomonas sp. UWO 241]
MDVLNGLQYEGVALKKLVVIASSPGSHDDACMGALRERILDCGVLPDLMTALAGAWSITSAAYMPALGTVSVTCMSALMHAIQTWESDVQRIVTPSAVAAVLTISEGLWRLELQGRTHVPLPSSGGNDSWQGKRELSRFLSDSSEPVVAPPKLRAEPPQRAARDVYHGAAHLFNLLHAIMMSDDLRDVVPDPLPLLNALLATLRTQLVFRASCGMWGAGLHWDEELPGAQLQSVDGERDLARFTDINAAFGMQHLVGLLRTVLPVLRGGDAGVLAAVAHDAACAAWAALALDPMSHGKHDVETLVSTHNDAVQVLLMLHTAELLQVTPPAVALASRLLTYPWAQRPSESVEDAVSLLVLEAQTASHLARLLMVIAAKSEQQPGALEAVFSGVRATAARVVAQIKTAVSASHGHLLLLALHKLDRCALEQDAVAAAVAKAHAVIHCWRVMPQSMSPLLRELGRAIVILPRMEQASDRSRAALQLLPAIASLGALALDSSIEAVRKPEYIRSLKDKCWALEAKLAMAKADAEAAKEDSRAASKKFSKEASKAASKNDSKGRAKQPAPNAAPNAATDAATDAATEDVGGGQVNLKMSAEDSRRLEQECILVQLLQFENLCGEGATTLLLVTEACAAVLAPQESQHTRGLAALPLLRELESTGVLELLSVAGDWIGVLLEASAPLLEPEAAHKAAQPGCRAADDVAQEEQAVGTGRSRQTLQKTTMEKTQQRQVDVAAALLARMHARRACGAAAALMALAGGWLRAAHGLMSVAGAAVAEALAEAQEASAGGDGSGASAVLDAADAAHRFVCSMLEDSGHSNTGNGNRFSSRDSNEAQRGASLMDAITRKGTTLSLLCSPHAARVMSLQPDLLAQLDVPPKEHPSLLLPSLLVRVAHEMTLVCNSIVTSVAQPEPQVHVQVQQQQQQQQQQLGAPLRRLLTVASDDDDSSDMFGSPLGSILGASGSDDWASVGTGAGTSSSRGGEIGEYNRWHSSGGGALVEPASHKPPASPESHDHGSAGPVPAPQPQRKPDPQSRLLDSLDTAALHGELAIVEAIQAVHAATGAPVSNVRVSAASQLGMGIARYRPPLMCACAAGTKRQQQQRQQQLARPAVDGAPVGLVDALASAHKECNDLLSAVAHVLDAARPALLQVSSKATEAHGSGGSGLSTEVLPRWLVMVQDVFTGLPGLPGQYDGG